MTERFNPIPKRFRPFVYGGLTIVGLAAAACGGSAKANNENPTQIPTQPVATEAPKASPTPELSVEEKILASTEVKLPEKILEEKDVVVKIMKTKLPASSDPVNVDGYITRALQNYDPQIELERNNRVGGLDEAAVLLTTFYCNNGRDIEVLRLYHDIQVRVTSELDEWVRKGLVIPLYRDKKLELYFNLERTCQIPKGKG